MKNINIEEYFQQLNQKLWNVQQNIYAELEEYVVNAKREIWEEACKISISNEAIIQLVASVQHPTNKVEDGSRVAKARKPEEGNFEATLEMRRFDDGIDDDNSTMRMVFGEDSSRFMIPSSLMYQDGDFQHCTVVIAKIEMDKDTEEVSPLKSRYWLDEQFYWNGDMVQIFRWVFDGGGELLQRR